jgi:hypothetical protein
VCSPDGYQLVRPRMVCFKGMGGESQEGVRRCQGGLARLHHPVFES